MNRRKWILLASLVVAVVAAVWGALIATGQSGDSSRKPEGKANVIRLQAASEEVSCGPAPALVRIYLDDLVPRPSPDNPDVSFGLIAFQLPIQYDPSIVRLVAPNEVQIDSQLGQQDIDGDGILRAFLPVLSIDDEAGQAMIGAVSYVPSSRGGPRENQEEGIDPVAKAEPLLLATLRFTPIDFGTTEIRVEPWLTDRGEARLVDPDVKDYENLVFENTTLTVRGGTCVAAPTPPPTETPRPTATPVLTPTPFPTPAPVVGVPAHEGGRTDCPADWYVYNDADGYFSVCFPAGWDGTVSLAQAYFGNTLALAVSKSYAEAAAKYVQLTIYWAEISPFDEGVSRERCDSVSQWQDLRETPLTIAQRTVIACVGYETFKAPDAPPLLGTHAEFAVGPGLGYIVLFAIEPEGLSRLLSQELESVLVSLRVGE